MNLPEMIIVGGLVTLAIVYVILRARRNGSRAGSCEGHCGCAKPTPVRSDRQR